MNLRIQTMLAAAYRRLSVPEEQLERWVREAEEYMVRDREHYIEVAEQDVPEYTITELHGRICRLIPFAQEITSQQKQDHLLEITRVYSLMVTGETVRYVFAYDQAKLYPCREDNFYRFPIYRYVELADIPEALPAMPPQEIRPVATAQDREVYALVQRAFDWLCGDQDMNRALHKTERAMLALDKGWQEEITLEGKTVTGTVLQLAGGDLHEQMRPNHRYGRRDELCLLVTPESARYVLKSMHFYNYFRLRIYDNVPGGWAYRPVEEKQELTYEPVSPEDITQRMYPLYN